MHGCFYLAILGNLAAACGSGENSNVSINDLPNAIIDKMCNDELQCDGVADLATCKASLESMTPELETLVADVKGGIIIYDAAKFGECLDEDRSQGCLFPGFQGGQNDPCSSYLTGTIAMGGACFYGNECVSSQCDTTNSGCDASTTCCPGTCAAVNGSAIALGDTCTPYDVCIDSYCKGVPPALSGTCTALVTTAGAACDAVNACAGTMMCNLTSSTGGTCYQPASEGGTCDPTFTSFVNLECLDQRDYCDATTSKCVAGAAVGDTCSSTIPCKGIASCVNGKCVANPAAGDACDPMHAPFCIGNLNCTNSRCVLSTSGPSCR